MNTDDELVKIFDDVGQAAKEAQSEVAEEPDKPSSSKTGEEMDEDVIPIDPVSTVSKCTIDEGGGGGAIKRKTGKPEGAVGSKRVRIDEPTNNDEIFVSEAEFLDTFVNMGYDKGRVTSLFLVMGKVKNANIMLDKLLCGEQQDYSVCEDNDDRKSMFDEPIRPTSEDILEQLQKMSDHRPTSHSLPPFIDLCDEIILRKLLNLKFPATEETRALVVRTAALMAQRLSQVAHVATVARHSEMIFAMQFDLYKHFRDEQPSEPASDIIDRKGIQRETAPYGVLIDVAEAFVNNDGLKHISERIDDPAMSMKDIGHLCSILGDLSWMVFPGALDALMNKAAEKMRVMMREYSDKEIRDERTRKEIFESAKKVCKGMTPGGSTSISPRYEFIERLLTCGNMDAKKSAIEELAKICDFEMSETFSVRRWMKKRNILSILLADHLDHIEYVTKMSPILKKIAPVLSEREFRAVWCLQKGRGGMTTEIFYLLLANLASGFQDEQIVMLFKYFEKQTQRMPPQHVHLMANRLCDLVIFVLNRQVRAPVGLKDRQIFIECYIRLWDKLLRTVPDTNLPLFSIKYAAVIADLFRGLPSSVIVPALSKMAREINRMKEIDRRFPFFFALIYSLCNFIKMDMPHELRNLGPLLQHHKLIERGTRQLTLHMRHSLREVEVLEEVFYLNRSLDEMTRAREAALKRSQQQQQAATAADAAAASGDAAAAAAAAAAPSAACSMQPSPLVVAPPPSAVTPISNGPSPKRGEESPPGMSTTGAAEIGPAVSCSSSNGSSAAAASTHQQAAIEEMGNAQSSATVVASSATDCTPPCTPEPQPPQHLQQLQQPRKASRARIGSKEWERDLTEYSLQVHRMNMDVSFRLLHCMQLAHFWNDMTMSDEPVAGCEVNQLSAKSLEDFFGTLIDSNRVGLMQKLVMITGNWQANHVYAPQIMRNMMKRLEHRPVYRTFLSQLCAMPSDAFPWLFVDVVRAFADRCFSSFRYNTSTDWLEEILRLLWRLCTTSPFHEVRDRAVGLIQMILCERYRTLRLLTIFAAARINEAIDELNRLREEMGEEPVEHWIPLRDEEEKEMEEEEMKEKKEVNEEEMKMENGEKKEMEETAMNGEEKMEENGEEEKKVKKEEEEKEADMEQAVDLSMEPREKRVRMKNISRETLEIVLRGMNMKQEASTLEEAELRLSRAVDFLRVVLAYTYHEAEVPSDLVLRERALPGEVVDLTLKMNAQLLSTYMVSVHVTSNEPIAAVVERIKKMLPVTPPAFLLHWPNGYRLRHLSCTVQWDRFWHSIGDQMGLYQKSPDEIQVVDVWKSPFNDDFHLDANAKREGTLPARLLIAERPLGFVAMETQLLRIFNQICDRVTSSELQDAIVFCIQQLPFDHREESEDDEMLSNTCNLALSLQKPHEALFNLITLYSLLVPSHLTRETAETARRTFEFMRREKFPRRFMTMIREIDVISERLSVEVTTEFHEVCMSLIKLFFLKDSGRHRAYKKNAERLPGELAPIDTSAIVTSLKDGDLREILQTLINFTWVTIAPRRADVKREINAIVTSPSTRLRVARDKKIDFYAGSPVTYRRSLLSRHAFAALMDIATKYGSWERNANTLFNSDDDHSAVLFFRDLLLNTPVVDLQLDARNRLSQVLEKGRSEEERRVVRRLLVRLVLQVGRAIVWGPTAAAECAASGRNANQLVKLAERVVAAARKDDMGDGVLEEWIEAQCCFLSDERPVWSPSRDTRIQVVMQLQLLLELLKKLDRESMYKTMKPLLKPLVSKILFPFAVAVEELTDRHGAYPAARPIGYGIAEGDVRKKYMDFVLLYAQEQPERAMGLLEFLSGGVHGRVMGRREPIRMWEMMEKQRRHRSESGMGGSILGLRLPQLLLPQQQMDIRMVKGLLNPNFMCYVNSVLQQLVFIPGVCEALFALGDTDREFGDLTEEEDIKNGVLLRSLQQLFSTMLFSAETALSAEPVISAIELPNGGNVREQQDCVEFFLTLIDKCDAAAEKLNRRPVFKQHLEGLIGYEYACKTCKHRHRGSDESFTALNLEIHGTTLGESLDHYMDGGLLEGASAAMCEECGQKRTTLRMGALRRAPTTLAIQLKRFSTFECNGGKLNAKCDIPRELDLTRFGETVRTASDEQVDRMFGWFDDTQDEPVIFTPPADCAVRWRYRLVGVIVHSGQLGNGHYTSYTRERRPSMRDRPWYDQWLFINDDRVNATEEKLMMGDWHGNGVVPGEENSTSAYLVWYEMIEEDAEAERVRRRSTVDEEEEDKIDEDTVASLESTVADEEELEEAEKMEVDESSEETRKEEGPCDWVDIGLGSLGLLEGPLLQLWKTVPERLQQAAITRNINHQLGRDVLNESYSSFLFSVITAVLQHQKRKLVEDRYAANRKIFVIARRFMMEIMWRTRDENWHEAEATINAWKMLIYALIKEHPEFCKEWLEIFYDPDMQMISEEAREVITFPSAIRPCINAWWFITYQAFSGLRLDNHPELVDAYCRHMVESLRLKNLIHMDGYAAFFINTTTNPICVQAFLRHNVLPVINHVVFYPFSHYNNGVLVEGLGVRTDLTNRNCVPFLQAMFVLYSAAVGTEHLSEDEFKEFVEFKLAIAMGPMARHGEDYLMRIVELMNVTLETWGEKDPRWIYRLAQSILMCIKIDPNRAVGLFHVIVSVGKSVSASGDRSFYEEILGKSDEDAIDDGSIYHGLISRLETLLDEKKESRGTSLLETQVTRLIESVDMFAECAEPYQERLETIRIRLKELKNEEQNKEENTQIMAMQGAHELGSLPINDCVPYNRPQGSGRQEGEMLMTDDEMDEDDEDMMSDEEEYSEGEHPVNLTNHHRR